MPNISHILNIFNDDKPIEEWSDEKVIEVLSMTEEMGLSWIKEAILQVLNDNERRIKIEEELSKINKERKIRLDEALEELQRRSTK